MIKRKNYNVHITRALVPSFFTVLNMFAGFLSVISSADRDFLSAAWLVILAAIFDTLDGMMARLTKSASEFGVELDSLSDMVSFGVAPAFMIYKLGLSHLGPLGTLASAMVMVFGGLRLARFNVQLIGFDKEYFKGLPIPSSAITLSSFVILFFDTTTWHLTPNAEPFLLYLAIAVSLLMVSTVKYDTVPKFTRKAIKEHPYKLVVFSIGLLVAIVTMGKALFWLFLLYIVGGIARWIFQHIKIIFSPRKHKSDEEEIEFTGYDI